MLIVFNPTAGGRRRRRLARALEALGLQGLRPEVAETVRPGHATDLAREAAGRGVPLVVAAGGDGTIAEVASGLAGTAALLGILPFGTANVLASELGLPPAPERAARVLVAGGPRGRAAPGRGAVRRRLVAGIRADAGREVRRRGGGEPRPVAEAPRPRGPPVEPPRDGGDNPDVERRLARLEEDYKEIRPNLKVLRTDTAEIKGRLTGIEVRFAHIPTTLHLIGFAIAVLAVAGILRYFEPRSTTPASAPVMAPAPAQPSR
jgi:hypothetical protein